MSLLPASFAHAYLHARNLSRTGPGHAANGQFTAPDLLIRCRLGDQSPHALQRDRLADGLAIAFTFIPILVDLVVPGERPVDELDFSQPLTTRTDHSS
ncbi:hypothetical protein FVF58_20550 [Paraburkholderia panacisoli]|uniref:Uncharacterized protein n=1 Tax=Paraburkholderia panacisoli TaxID=2603818 RepID=A0A5B0H394_9BURK|nr:hypothetical protein [Paraburkholderia panacisoli]KAA1009696.1 hypothetical protein FVF58_20550 [Paraburkholderia panacisoli]